MTLSESSSGSESESESDDQTFQKNVVFKKPLKKSSNEGDKKSNNLIASSIVANNLKKLNESSSNSTTSLIPDESLLYKGINDTESESDYELWKCRELKRLHRDRNNRIKREEEAT